MACRQWLLKAINACWRPKIKSKPVEKTAQIEAILAEHLVGKDNWKEKNLGTENLAIRFEDAFNVSEEDIYQHVRLHGWDQRIVTFKTELPDPDCKESMFYNYIILPPINNRFPLAHFCSYDRQLWYKWDFGSQEELFRFIINKLIETQRSLWQYKYARR
ncbi:MAG: hypothetical protein V4695_08780 [Pseudomonadota bacterium]